MTPLATPPDTLAAAARALAAGTTTSALLVEHALQRIAQQPALNAFLHVNASAAHSAAAQSDARRAAGHPHGPLDGIPVAHKDALCTQGVPTTAGSRILEGYVPPYSATVVTQWEAAGLVSLGKTNMDEFAMGSSNENSAYGPVRNPWDLSRIPGGSSGGSAAAVAAGLVLGATGTDTGGSIRQPAALCGISGLKPTYGRVSRFGVVAYASSLDQVGPLARTVEDLAFLMDVTAGHDPRDSTSVDAPVPHHVGALDGGVKGLRIGIPREFMQTPGLDPRVASTVTEALRALEAQGAILQDVSIPLLPLSLPVYYVLAPAEASSNLARYDGVRVGPRVEAASLAEMYARTRGELFGAEVKRRILLGTYVLSAGYHDAYYVKAQKVRARLTAEFAKVLQEVDVLAGPTTPGPAFKLGEKTQDPYTMFLSDVFTLACNLVGAPGLSVPCGLVDGLPVGLQLMGRPMEETALLRAGHTYQQHTGWHRLRPPEPPPPAGTAPQKGGSHVPV
jgi:aspartyl-tRNA(Asn)/glutamyl-tRNA(Gln) amidotransferase subunit A